MNAPAIFDDMATLRSLLDSVPDAMLIADEDGRIRCFNEPARRLFGYGDEIEGEAVERLIPPHLTDLHRRHRGTFATTPRRRAMGSGLDLWARRADGVDIQVEISLSPIHVDGHAYVIASIRDTGPKRRARELQVRLQQQETLTALWEQVMRHGASEAGLREALLTLRDLFAALRIRLYDIDGDAIPARVRVLADTDKEAPSPYVELTSVADVAALFADERESTQGGQPPIANRLFAHGRQRTRLLLSLRAQGDMLGALAIDLPAGTTVTRDQLYLAMNVAHLVANAMARTRSDRLLLAAAKMEALGQLSGGIAHDFNNLLNIIIGNLELLGDYSADDDSRHLINIALRAARRGGDLTKRLLLFARRRPVIAGAQYLQTLLDDIVDVLRRAVGDLVEVELKVDPGLPPVYVDPSLLDACLVNLATNARDAMPNGGRLTLLASQHHLDAPPDGSVATDFRAGDYVALQVADTGEGMNKETLQRAFEPFFTTKPAGKGTGLGLSLIRSLTMQSGGRVALESHPGDGTCVTLYLPVATDASTPTEVDTGASPRGNGQMLLVVEDEPLVRSTACRMIEDLGYRTVAAESVPAAQALLKQRDDIALVFSDVVLGRDGSGVELQQYVRQNHAHLPVVLTSGYASPLLQRQGIDLNAVKLLGKPYSRSQLATTLSRALRRTQAAAG